MTNLLVGFFVAQASPEAILFAAQSEIERAMELTLPNQLPPHWIQIHAKDEYRITIGAQMGAIYINNTKHNRYARVDLRVGSPQLDNTNFQTFGSQDGVTLKSLPTDDNSHAIRRELWLALDKAYKGATEQYSAKMAALEGHPPPDGPDLLPAKIIESKQIEKAQFDENSLSQLVRHLSMPYKDPNKFEEFNVALRQISQTHIVVSSEGTSLITPQNQTILLVEAIRRGPDGEKHQSMRSWVVNNPKSLPELKQLETEVKGFTDWIISLDTAKQEDDYLGPVLFEPRAAAEVFRQLLPGEISGTPPQAEAPDGFGALPKPIAHSRIGRRLLPDGWHVTDNPSHDNSLVGYYQYDFEGTPVQDITLVENGIVKDLLMTRVPREGFEHSTGHGRGEGYRRQVAMPAVTKISPKRNLSMRKLKRKGIRLAKQTDRDYILVVRQLTPLPLAEDFEIAFSGDAPLAGLTSATEIYRLYSDGREEPLHGMQFLGVDRRVLRDIVAAGPQSSWSGMMDVDPSAARHGMGPFTGVPVSWSAPAILITELEMHTRSSHEEKILPPPPFSSGIQGVE